MIHWMRFVLISCVLATTAGLAACTHHVNSWTDFAREMDLGTRHAEGLDGSTYVALKEEGGLTLVEVPPIPSGVPAPQPKLVVDYGKLPGATTPSPHLVKLAVGRSGKIYAALVSRDRHQRDAAPQIVSYDPRTEIACIESFAPPTTQPVAAKGAKRIAFPEPIVDTGTLSHSPASASGPAAEYIQALLSACDQLEEDAPHYTQVADIVAQRHLNGGLIGFPWNYEPLQQELMGRSGGIVHVGFERPWKKDRTAAEIANDIAIIGWDRPTPEAAAQVKACKAKGQYVIGFGARDLKGVAEAADLCDAWFDTGLTNDGRVLKLPDGSAVGRANHVVSAIQGWMLMGEIISAFTRRGHMPAMWKSYSYPDGKTWGEALLGKTQWQDEYGVAPIEAGKLAHDYLRSVRYHLHRLERMELGDLQKGGELVAAEQATGRQGVIATSSHMPWTFAGKFEDAIWGKPIDVHTSLENQMVEFRKVPEHSLVVRLGYSGEHADFWKVAHDRDLRVILIYAEHPDAAYQPGPEAVDVIDMGYAFGDATLTIPRYPVRVLPASGYMQAVAYECVDVEALSRIGGASR